MADKEIPDIETAQGGATAATSGDKVHAFRSPNSRVVTLGDAAGKSVGTGAGTVAAGDTVAAQGASITALQTSEIVLRRNLMLSMADNAKALAGLRRYLDMVAIGFKASGDADASSSGGAVDTAAGAWKPTPSSTVVAGATGTAIGDMTGGGGLAAAFNGTTSQIFSSGAYKAASAAGYNNTVGKDWGSGNTKTIARFVVYASNDYGVLGVGGGSSVKLQGSNNGSAWTDLYTSGTVLTAGGTTLDVSSGIDTSTAYRYHRLNVNGNGSNSVDVVELVFYEVSGTTNALLITPYQTADAARTKVRGIFDIDPVDAITLGTDWTVEYTCNGGTNWHAASTYTNCGKGQSGRTVIETDEVSCTSGTSFAARVKNLNNKNVHVHKASLKAAA